MISILATHWTALVKNPIECRQSNMNRSKLDIIQQVQFRRKKDSLSGHNEYMGIAHWIGDRYS